MICNDCFRVLLMIYLFEFDCFSGSTDVFLLNLTDPNANILEKFNNHSPYAFLIHGFTDAYPGNWKINGKGEYVK